MPRSARATTPLPILVEPVFDVKPWGSRRLESLCGDIPDGLIGEALLTAPGARVGSGPESGQTLGDLALSSPHYWCGEQGLRVTGGRMVFPLLAKIIDATETLSVQVHPDDALAATRGLGTGKTEAWHILDAAPGAVVYAGLRDGVEHDAFRAACGEHEDVSMYLNAIPASEGMTVVIPAGTVHAIGGGLLLYEIQQPSNVTYRLNDWGRVGETGAPRPLHHADGFAAMRTHVAPRPAPRVRLTDQRTLLAATRYFALEQVALQISSALTFSLVQSPQVLTARQGVVEISLKGVPGSIIFSAGQTVIVPADTVATLVAGSTATLLRGWVPELGEDAVEPAQAADVATGLVMEPEFGRITP